MHTLRVTTVNAFSLAFCSLSRAVSTPIVEIASPDPMKAHSFIPSATSIFLPQFSSTYACSRPYSRPPMLRVLALQLQSRIFRAVFDYGLV